MKPALKPAPGPLNEAARDEDDARTRAWIALGGNVGGPERVAARFAAVTVALSPLSVTPLVLSPIVHSAPWGVRDQPPFLNQVIGLHPQVGPTAFLAELQRLEDAFGRDRSTGWGPRTLDLDLLCWPDLTCATERLTLPHPRLAERRFVLWPWAAVAPAYRVPGLGQRVDALLAACEDDGWVEPYVASAPPSPERAA